MKKKKRIDRQDYLTEHVIVDDIKELHKKYIGLFADLHNHFTVVDDEFYIAAQKALTDQYKSELAYLYEKYESKTLGKFYMASRVNFALKIYSMKERPKWYKRGVWVDSPAKQALDAQLGQAVADVLYELTGTKQQDNGEDIDAGFAEEIEKRINDLIESLSQEFATPFKRGAFIKENTKYITRLLTDYPEDHDVNEISVKIYDALVKRFVKEKKREKFNERNEEYIKGLLIEYLRSFSEPEEESEAVPDSEESENVVEEPKDEQDAENGAVDGENEDAEEDNIAEELGDLNELQALEVELAEEHTGEEIKVDSENAEQLEIVVPEPPKTEPQKFALMLIPQAMPWDIIRNNAAAEPKAVKEASKDEPIKNIDEGG